MFDMSNELPIAEKVLVLSPHPDDETIGCGGAICNYIKKGSNVTIAFATNGENGLSNNKMKESPLTRRKEALNSANILGVQNLHWLDLPDGGLSHKITELREQIEILNRRVRPQIIYIPSYFEEHPDHFALCKAFAESNIEYNGLIALYEVWSPLRPNFLLNISRWIKIKEKALNSYCSQQEFNHITKMMLALNEYRGARQPWIRALYAEAFRMVDYSNLKVEFKKFCTIYN